MSRTFLTTILAAAVALPTLAQAQNTRIPLVRIPATVTGIWALDPLACPDIREDIRDARRTTSRADRREDRRDQRVIDCPPSAWRFLPNPGQAPNRPIRVNRDGSLRLPGPAQPGYGYTPPPAYTPPPPPAYTAPTTTYQPQYQAPTYAQPQYQAPTYNTQPQYTAPTYNTQPNYVPTTPTYSQPTYQ